MTPLELVVSKLEEHGCNPRGNGNKFEFRCPLHDDRHASAGPTVGADGGSCFFAKSAAGSGPRTSSRTSA
jgi:hypothetical protein